MPATPGDLTLLLMPRVAAALGIGSISTTVQPTQTQVIAGLNEGVREAFMRLLPQEMEGGKRLPGRTDKLTRQTGMETETGAAGFCELPHTGHVETPGISHYVLVSIGGVTAVRVPRGEITDRVSGTFAATAAAPIFAWGDNGTYNGIYYLPTAATAMVYYFLSQPIPMEISVATDTVEDFRLDDDLMPAAQHYALMRSWEASAQPKAPATAAVYRKLFEAQVGMLLGLAFHTLSQEVT